MSQIITSLHGKVAIVTGGAQGIGKALCLALLENDVKVYFCDIDKKTAVEFLESVSETKRRNINFLECDVTSIEDFRIVFDYAKKTWGKIDIVVNNAGIMNELDSKRTVDVNLNGVINGVKLAFEYMGKNNGGKGGVVVNIASVSGFVPLELAPVYCATKHAVVGLTRAYSEKYHHGKTGVSVSALCPSCVESRMVSEDSPLTVDKDLAVEFVNSAAKIKMKDVEDAFIQLLKDGHNGSLMRVDEHGTRYVYMNCDNKY